MSCAAEIGGLGPEVILNASVEGVLLKSKFTGVINLQPEISDIALH